MERGRHNLINQNVTMKRLKTHLYTLTNLELIVVKLVKIAQSGNTVQNKVIYHVSCEPLRIFWKDDTTCST